MGSLDFLNTLKAGADPRSNAGERRYSHENTSNM
jgi:hypothetical protein